MDTTNTSARHHTSLIVQNYIYNVQTHHPEIIRNLTDLYQSNNLFSDLKTYSQPWTYTDYQRNHALEQLERISKNYPVPSALQEKITFGLSLDTTQFSSVDELHRELDIFIKNIKKPQKNPEQKNIITTIGSIPLVPVHQSNSSAIFDPYLDGKIESLSTLDVTYNHGLSIKDVIARQMIEDALENREIDETTTIVEATSGNTGAGLAIIASLYGLPLILVIPDKISMERIERLRNMGAHTIIAPTKVNFDDPRSYYAIRDYLAQKQNFWTPQQYDNLSNSKAHELYTGPQIWEESNGEITAVIATVGTGGTISGIGKFLKQKNPNIKIIGVDPIGSILYLLKEGKKLKDVQHLAHSYDIQGFGEDIQPKNINFDIIDSFIRISDAEGFAMTRLLPALGFLQGQSSGASYVGVLKAIEQGLLTKTDKAIVIFPDTAVPYRTDVFNDEWMRTKNYPPILRASEI
ncbi:MAG: cysteine synthase family protein [Candidatus Roizmanbacteria bacterium]